MFVHHRLVATLALIATAMAATTASRADSPAPASPPSSLPVEIVAHRGESHDAPENTLAAINLAWQRGVQSVEIDVHLTKDGKLITIHDADTLRVTGGPKRGGQKLIVLEHTADELQSSTWARGSAGLGRASGCR
jgi:glycerophosphoryl diester phosphodiesterase